MNTKMLKKINFIFIIIILCIIVLLINFNLVFAGEINIVESVKTIEIQPTDNQFLELRAVEINEVEGQNKQLIMELWGNELEFKRI